MSHIDKSPPNSIPMRSVLTKNVPIQEICTVLNAYAPYDKIYSLYTNSVVHKESVDKTNLKCLHIIEVSSALTSDSQRHVYYPYHKVSGQKCSPKV